MRLRPFRLNRLHRAAILRAAARARRPDRRRFRRADGPQGLARAEGKTEDGVQEQDARGLVQDHGRHRHLLCAGADHVGSDRASAYGRPTGVRRAPRRQAAGAGAALFTDDIGGARAGRGGDRRSDEGVEGGALDPRRYNNLRCRLAKAGTHNHRERFGEESEFGTLTDQIDKSRGMGPGLRRDDTCFDVAVYVKCATYAASTFSTPRRIWSSSIDSNSALKLPSPKPSSPLRWMNSKKMGPIALAENICSSTLVWPPSTTPSPSIRMPFFCRRATSSPCFGNRASIRSK